MKNIITIIVIIVIVMAGLISIESDRRAYALRNCIINTNTNSDGLTIDKEGMDLCIKAYDKRTSRSYELQKAIKRPQINKSPILL